MMIHKKASIFLKGTGAAAGVAAALLACSEYERRHMTVDRYVLTSPRIRDREKNLVFLTDLHEHRFPESMRPGLLESIRAIRPDAVLVGGDMIYAREPVIRWDVSLGLLRELAAEYPVFYADGNHEDRMDWSSGPDGRYRNPYLRALEGAGVRFLRDRSEDFGGDIRITGLSVEKTYYGHRFRAPRLSENYIVNRVGACGHDRYRILLLHSPLFFPEAAEWGADLMLSGHFHGGTIRIPGLGGLMTPQYQFFHPWCAGRFEKGDTTMIVGRGLGTHSVNVRINNRPQLVWITLRPEE